MVDNTSSPAKSRVTVVVNSAKREFCIIPRSVCRAFAFYPFGRSWPSKYPFRRVIEPAFRPVSNLRFGPKTPLGSTDRARSIRTQKPWERMGLDKLLHRAQYRGAGGPFAAVQAFLGERSGATSPPVLPLTPTIAPPNSWITSKNSAEGTWETLLLNNAKLSKTRSRAR